MSYTLLDMKMVVGTTFPNLMEGVEAVKKDGWEAMGTPYPCNLPHGMGYGMMQMVVKDRSEK